MRSERNVRRQSSFTIPVDGFPVTAFPGETLATVLLEGSSEIGPAAGGKLRGVFCNMGTCGQCIVTLLPERRRVRACLVPAERHMRIARD